MSAADSAVTEIRFSPAGDRIALILTADWSIGGQSRLVIIDREHPNVILRQFELNEVMFPEDPSALFWSPKGDNITVHGTVIDVRSGKRCSGPGTTGYIDDEHRISQRTLRTPEFPTELPVSRFVITGPGCQEQSVWEVKDLWALRDVSQGQGLGVFARLDPEPAVPRVVEFVIVNIRERRVIRRWPASLIAAPDVRFAEGGRAMCAGGGVNRRGKFPVRCWDVDGGGEISEASGINGGWPLLTASESSRILASDLRFQPYVIMDGYTEVLRRFVIWDFRSKQELASWHPDKQTYRLPFLKGERRTAPFATAISPDGRWVAEGGSGVLRLYRVDP